MRGCQETWPEQWQQAKFKAKPWKSQTYVKENTPKEEKGHIPFPVHSRRIFPVWYILLGLLLWGQTDIYENTGPHYPSCHPPHFVALILSASHNTHDVYNVADRLISIFHHHKYQSLQQPCHVSFLVFSPAGLIEYLSYILKKNVVDILRRYTDRNRKSISWPVG